MTAQEDFRMYQENKAKERNAKKYHTEAIRKYSGLIVAECGNWFYKLVIFKDNSAALCYIAKPGSGCANGIYCGTDILKYHFNGITPKDWKIKEEGFFKTLEIA